MSNDTNDQLALIVGYSTTGKSASLRNIRDQPTWMYLNAEAGKRLPFRGEFDQYRITDPWQVHEAFEYATTNPTVKGVIVDSITFLMDMFESQYIINATNTQKAWSDFAQFFKTLMQDKVVQFGRPTIFTAHVRDDLDERSMEMKTAVPIKGSLKNNGVEAYFSTVVAAKKMQVKELDKYGSKLLTISDEERDIGYKHVFQTRPTKGTTGERIRSPMGMFPKEETYIDNDAQLLLDRLEAFYR